MDKPYQTYNGGKEADGTYQKIINRIPPHCIYIEAFLGNGAIYRHKKPAQWNIGIDKDTAVISGWEKLHLPGLTLINTDAISWLGNFLPLAGILKDLGVRVFIYLDPPYPKNSRKNPKNLYAHEMTDEQHGQLLKAIKLLSPYCIAMVSSYPNNLYDGCLPDWHTTTFQSQTRNGLATEKLWMNYATPAELHDYRYLGNDYRERERIKGILTRNTAKFKRMPDLERNALIESLKKEKLI